MRRPVLRYFGGKFRLAPWIMSHFPPHRIYTEVFGGAASVLMCKPKSKIEVYNDLDGQLVNLFRVIRDHGDKLQRIVEMTPYSREEYIKSGVPSDDPIEQARRTLVKSWFSIGTDSLSRGNCGFRCTTDDTKVGTLPLHQWPGYATQIHAFRKRLDGVLVENDDALAVLDRNDAEDALHYVDPPYVMSTRSSGGYSFEMDEAQHLELINKLNSLSGLIILSGYDSDLYRDSLQGWEQKEKEALADSRAKRTEVIWLNKAASEAINTKQLNLWGQAA